MNDLTSRERVARVMNRQSVDRLPVAESFWPETRPKWVKSGFIGENENIEDHFDLDIRNTWAFNLVADLDFKEEIVAETEETKTVLNGNAATLRWWKDSSGTPEHIDFMVKDRQAWLDFARDKLADSSNYSRRINFDKWRQTREQCNKDDRWFVWGGVNVFESIHPITGHEHMLMGMALDPDWVRDMAEVYADLFINLCEILFAEEGKPDGIWFFEDMGFKNRPFMSPQMYKDLIFPSHKKTFDFVHSQGLSVTVHSCGFVEPLVPALIEAGMDCLQAMEVKAGMDLLRIKKTYGDKIVLCGGLDARAIESNDRAQIEAELQSKIPTVMDGGGYILHSDHSISPRVDYESYRFFVNKGLELGTYG